MIRWQLNFCVLILGCICHFGFAELLLAHGGGTPQLTAAKSGPYQVFAWTSPEPLRVGANHFTVAVTLATGDDVVDDTDPSLRLDEIVLDAAVEIVLIPVDQPENIITVSAHTSQINQVYFEADATLPSSGDWQVNIIITGPLGTGDVGFRSTVAPARQINWRLITVILLVILIVIYAARARYTVYRPNRRAGAISKGS